MSLQIVNSHCWHLCTHSSKHYDSSLSINSYFNIGLLQERHIDNHPTECRQCRWMTARMAVFFVFLKGLMQVFYRTLLTRNWACHNLSTFYSFLSLYVFSLRHLTYICILFLKNIAEAPFISVNSKWFREHWKFCKNMLLSICELFHEIHMLKSCAL